MIELKQVYAGRARVVFPTLQDPHAWGPCAAPIYDVLDFQDRALPEELVTATLQAWARKPFVSTTPLQLQVEDVGQPARTYDVFIWVYVRDGEVFPSLQAALSPKPPGWKP